MDLIIVLVVYQPTLTNLPGKKKHVALHVKTKYNNLETRIIQNKFGM
jgi:hypothetical protein